MLRLGNIVYSNCYPVHAKLLEERPSDIEVVDGTPAELNRALAAGRIDVAPCSSIEYARHADRYRVLAGLAIASHGAVESILLETTVPLDRLEGRTIALPTASATSVVLLRTLLEIRLGVRPRYTWFDQTGPDPVGGDVAAALRIGDIALRRSAPANRVTVDLGREWTAWTDLPFVYAVWQCGSDRDGEALRLREILLASHAWFRERLDALAERKAEAFGLDADRLARYWRGLRYGLDEAAMAGLLRFYALSAELGEAPVTTSLNVLPHTT